MAGFGLWSLGAASFRLLPGLADSGDRGRGRFRHWYLTHMPARSSPNRSSSWSRLPVCVSASSGCCEASARCRWFLRGPLGHRPRAPRRSRKSFSQLDDGTAQRGTVTRGSTTVRDDVLPAHVADLGPWHPLSGAVVAAVLLPGLAGRRRRDVRRQGVGSGLERVVPLLEHGRGQGCPPGESGRPGGRDRAGVRGGMP